MYQMYAYSKKYNTPDVWLLYPMNEKMHEYSDKKIYEDKEQIVFRSNDGVIVRVFFINLANDVWVNSLLNFIKK